MTTQVDEMNFLQSLIPQFRAEGYDVYLQPSAPVVPDFLADLHPDAIAIGKGKKIIIELVTSEGADQRKTEALANLVQRHPEWELRVFVVTSASQTDELRVQSPAEIEASLKEVRELETSGHTSAALLLAWGTFEAVARRLISGTFERPQTPRRIVQYLAQEGYVTPSEADILRVLAQTRNGIIHGNLHARPSKGDVDFLARVLERLSAESVGT